MKKIIILKQIAALVLLLCLHPIIWAQEIKENTTGDPQVSEKHEDQTGSNQMTEEELELWNQAMKAFYYHKKEHFKSLPQSENDIIFWVTALRTMESGQSYSTTITLKTAG